MNVLLPVRTKNPNNTQGEAMKRKVEAWAAVGAGGEMGALGYGRELAAQYAADNEMSIVRFVPADPARDAVVKAAVALIHPAKQGRAELWDALQSAVERMQRKGRKP